MLDAVKIVGSRGASSIAPAVAHDVLEHEATTAEGHWHGSLDLALCRDTAAAAAAVVDEEGNHDSMPSFVTVLSPSNIELTNGISIVYRARVLVLFHYVFHNTTCSVPPVGLHKSTDDGLTTTTPSLTSQSLFYVSTMAVLPR